MPYAIIGAGGGCAIGKGAKRIKTICKNASVVCLRDEKTATYIKKLTGRKDIITTADIALTLKSEQIPIKYRYELKKRIGDKISISGSYQHDAYYKGPRMQRFWHYIRLKESSRLLNAISTDFILDIGCGSGLFASIIATETKATVLGIDSNKDAIGFCQSQYSLNNLSFEEHTTDEIHFSDNSFDKVVLLEVIEHITKDQGIALLKKIHSLLKPGGELVLSTPNKRSLWPIIEFLMDKLKLAPTMYKEQHEILYNRKELNKLATEACLSCTKEKTILLISPWMAALNWKLGLYFHKMEMKFKTRLGSILLHSFMKSN